MKTSRRGFLKAVSIGTLGLCTQPAWSAALRSVTPPQTNLLFLFPDQWRAQAFGHCGDPNVRTPNLDRLAAQGTEFTRAYSNHPVCSPARATLMTGLYSHQTGFLANNFYLPQNPDNLGYRLKDAGYTTGYIGKWHMDGPERPGFVPPNRRQGWDDFHGFNRGHWYRLNDPDESRARYFTPEGELVYSEIFEPILQTDLAINFIDRQKANEPWALIVSYGPPHDPYTPPPSHQRLQPADLQWRKNVPDRLRSDPETNRDACGYYGLCELMDEQIGRVLRHLDESGQADNTIVVFCSDHGDMLGSHGRHQKLLPFEEASAVPLLVRGPGIPAGQKVTTPVSIIDLPTTFISLAGGKVPERMQGRDLTPALRGKTLPEKSVLMEGLMHQEDRQWRAIVTDRYKLVLVAKEKAGDGEFDLVDALYDLQEDPFELKNLYHDPAHQSIVQELTAERASRVARTGDVFPNLSKAAPKTPES